MNKQQNNRTPLLLTVQNSVQISPSIQRITLQGESIAHFGVESTGDYFKLLFTPSGGTDLSMLGEDERPLMRTYSIREFAPETNSIMVDFVRHETSDLSCGFAARWANNAKIGDTISIVGPGKSQTVNQNADWVFLAADMTALPALSATLASLDSATEGYAVIEVAQAADIQPLSAPQNVNIIWAITSQGSNLVDTVKAQPWLEGQCSVWCACEFDAMRTLRQFFRNDKDIDRDYIYISSYWKKGVSEDGHKVIKREDAQINQG